LSFFFFFGLVDLGWANGDRTAYDLNRPFADLLNHALALPIFDGGNVGVRKRHLQQLMQSPTYDAWAATYGPVETDAT